jgi:hypothetical protein
MSETKFKIGDRVVYDTQVMTVVGTDEDLLTCVWQGPHGTRRMDYRASAVKLFVTKKPLSKRRP